MIEITQGSLNVILQGKSQPHSCEGIRPTDAYQLCTRSPKAW